MNPMMRAMSLLRGGLGGLGNGFASSSGDILNSPEIEERQTRYDAARSASAMPKESSIERIKGAFEALKDMHKGDNQAPAWLSQPMYPPQTPMRPAMNANAMQPSPQPTPMQEAAVTSDPMMTAFQRNIALQKDPMTGEYLDPESAAKANPGIFNGLFA